MALITLLNAQLAFGHVALLDHTGFSLETNERVGLIGRNGAGKSSLLNTHRILSSVLLPDPEGPIRAMNSPRRTCKVMSCNTSASLGRPTL